MIYDYGDRENIRCQYPGCLRQAECVVARHDDSRIDVCRRCRKIVILNLEKYGKLVNPSTVAANSNVIMRPNSTPKNKPQTPISANESQQPAWLREAAKKAEAAADVNATIAAKKKVR